MSQRTVLIRRAEDAPIVVRKFAQARFSESVYRQDKDGIFLIFCNFDRYRFSKWLKKNNWQHRVLRESVET